MEILNEFGPLNQINSVAKQYQLPSCSDGMQPRATIFHGCQKPLAVCYRNNSRLENYRRRSSIKCLGTFRVNVFERYGVPQTAGSPGIK